MTAIRHRFFGHKLNPETETLIVGTFNPEAEKNDAEFFYGRKRNFLWRLLPIAIGLDDLKNNTKNEKLAFIQKNRIDFIDLITEVDVAIGEETNYEDKYLDDKVTEWRNVVDELKKLKKLKRVAFTRKTVNDIPQMKLRIEEVKRYCDSKQIPFRFLKTPARTYSPDKQKIWTAFFKDDY
jgi:G:T/U-mismatch repair DNA glycosylase